MIIRQERPEDYDTVYHVVKEAFENAEYTDGNEQNLVAALRKKQIVYSGKLYFLLLSRTKKIVRTIFLQKASCSRG